MSGTAQRRVLYAEEADQRQALALIEATGGQVDRLISSATGESVQIPASLARILQQVVQVMASGGTVVVSSSPDELTTTVASERLGISRPTLMKMIDNGEINARKVGSHRRLKTTDVESLRRGRLADQRAAFEELRRLEDELDR